MAEPIPRTTSQWNVVGTEGVASLQLSEQAVPELGDNQVLVKREYSLLRRGYCHSQSTYWLTP